MDKKRRESPPGKGNGFLITIVGEVSEEMKGRVEEIEKEFKNITEKYRNILNNIEKVINGIESIISQAEENIKNRKYADAQKNLSELFSQNNIEGIIKQIEEIEKEIESFLNKLSSVIDRYEKLIINILNELGLRIIGDLESVKRKTNSFQNILGLIKLQNTEGLLNLVKTHFVVQSSQTENPQINMGEFYLFLTILTNLLVLNGFLKLEKIVEFKGRIKRFPERINNILVKTLDYYYRYLPDFPPLIPPEEKDKYLKSLSYLKEKLEKIIGLLDSDKIRHLKANINQIIISLIAKR